MKHLDALFDELQEPIQPLMDWCDDDNKDRAVVACLRDLFAEKSARVFEALSEAKPDCSAENIINWAYEILDQISFLGSKPDIEYVDLYQPFEHIINDRIEVYNKS